MAGLSADSPGSVSLSPLLNVRQGASAIDFYKAAFGAEEILRVDDGEGEVVAQMSVGGARFWLADESADHLNFSPESLGGSSVRMVMVVDDPDAVLIAPSQPGR